MWIMWISSSKKGVAGICLMVGIGIYLLFRSRQLLVFSLVDVVGGGTLVDELRMAVSDVRLPDFVRFCLPDALWASAYILIIDGIFRKEKMNTRLAWASFIPCVGAVSELLQGATLIPGTFDTLDLMAYLLPLTIYVGLAYYHSIICEMK